jgi:hypothetical protein
MKIPTVGGESRSLSNYRFDLRILWGRDDNIYLSSLRSLMRIPAAGGKLDTVGKPEPEGSDAYRVPFQFLPGNRLLIGTGRLEDSATEIAVFDLQTEQKTVVLTKGSRASYASTGLDTNAGYIVYHSADSLVAAPFDLERLALRGSPVTVLAGDHVFGVSDTGMLAYVPRSSSQSNVGLAWIDRQGTEHPDLDWVRTAFASITVPPRLSPKGDRLAIVDRGDVWVYNLADRRRLRLTSHGNSSLVVWTRDGKRVIYSVGTRNARVGGTLVSAPADNSGPPTTLLADGKNYVPQMVTSDRRLIARLADLDDPGSIYVAISLADEARQAPPERVFESPYQVTGLQVSPDGRLLAYQSNEAGRSEVYVTPFPGPGPRTPISTSGGSAPRWGDNGELFFVDGGGTLMAVEVQSSPTFHVGQLKALFKGAIGGFEPAPGGQRFLMPWPIVADARPSELHIVVNLVDELRRRVP